MEKCYSVLLYRASSELALGFDYRRNIPGRPPPMRAIIF